MKIMSEKKGLDIRNFSLKDYLNAEINKMKGDTDWRSGSKHGQDRLIDLFHIRYYTCNCIEHNGIIHHCLSVPS